MALTKPRELLGHPYNYVHHNAAGNGKRDGSKSIWIGQSAAKLPGDREKVQRSAYGVLPGFAGKMVKCHERGAMSHSIEDMIRSAWKRAGARNKHPGH